MAHARSAAMLAALVCIAPATAAAPPEPKAKPAASTSLKEIGRVRVTSPFCRAELERAIGAVNIVLGNDTKLAHAEETLRQVDLDTSEITKHKGTEELNRQYVALRAAAVDGRRLTRQFNDEARKAESTEQQQALLALGHALDGALDRQKQLADDLGRLVVYVDNHPPLDEQEHDRLVFEALKARNAVGFAHQDEAPLATVPDPLTDIAKAGAAELELRAQALAGDEDAAAARLDPAFNRC